MSHSSSSPIHARSAIWPWIFLLVALEGMAAAAYLAGLPTDPGGRFLGFSANRLLLIAIFLGGTLAFGLLAWRARRAGFVVRRGIAIVLCVLLPLVALGCLIAPLTLLNLYHTGGEFRYLAYSQRLQPLFTWLLLASLEIFGGLAYSGVLQWQALRDQRIGMLRGGTLRVFRAGLVVWALAGLVCIFVALTGTGIVPDVVGWGMPTVSLMEWQIWLAWAAGIALLLWLTFRRPKLRVAKNNLRASFSSLSDCSLFTVHSLDLLLAASIWLLAASLWLSQPIRPAFFATAGRAPNDEIYPFSDGAYYDHFAQSVLIGNGFKGDEIPARPMYVTLLAGFHLLAGQKYEAVIAAQTLLLAFFPVILYFLGKALHSRPVGLSVALLAILRELTAIVAMPFTDNASNSKLFFADLPAAMAVSLWALLVVLWLRPAASPAGRPASTGTRLLPLMVGGGLGVAMLFRTQSMFMLPAVLLLALFVFRFQWKRWLRAVWLVGLCLALTLIPWLWRNGSVTGRLAFDDDKSQTGAMAQRYSLSGSDPAYSYQAGEDPRAYSARVTQGIFTFLFAHPDVVAGFVSAHLLNAEIANVLVLPIRGGIADPRELVMPLRATWQDWNGTLTPWQGALLAVNLGLIALGIGAGWSRRSWAGFALLLMNMSYNFSNALARNSGGRYLLVVDWVMYTYAAIGLMEIAVAALTLLGVSPERFAALLPWRAQPEAQQEAESLRQHPAKGALNAASNSGSGLRPLTPHASLLTPIGICLAFVFIGALPALAERLVPARYPQQTRAELAAEALRNTSLPAAGADRAALESFLAQPDAIIIKGRALYPRYYAVGQGEQLTAKTGYEPLDYARTVFLITANNYNGLAILKAQAVPGFFPNASDVIVIGCPGGAYLDARLVLVLDGKDRGYVADSGLRGPCPAVGIPSQ